MENRTDKISGIVGNEFPIVASSPWPQSMVTSESSVITVEDLKEIFREMHECGFNIGRESTAKYNNTILNNVVEAIYELYSEEDIRIGFLPSNANLNNPDKCKEFVKKFMSQKAKLAICGWDMADEPKYDRIPNLRICLEKVAAADPSRLLFINLIGMKTYEYDDNGEPIYNDIYFPSGWSYDTYLDYIEEELDPEVWSFDLYPIFYNNTENKIDFKSQRMYQALESFHAISEKTGKPFWYYILSQEMKSPDGKRIIHPRPEVEHIRGLAFNALAFGAQGILYWTYGQRNSGASSDYTDAPILSDGSRSQIWYSVQTVNSEIRRFSRVFLGCRCTKFYYAGNQPTGRPPFETNLMQPVTIFKLFGDGNGVLVSYLYNDGTSYVMIVSQDIENSQRVSIEIGKTFKVYDITRAKNDNFSDAPEVLSCSYILKPGQYKIFRYRNRLPTIKPDTAPSPTDSNNHTVL